MVNWNQIQNATSPDNKPTAGWQFNEIIKDVRNCPKEVPDVAEYLMQCVCSDQLNIQLKAVLCVKHLSAEDITFQQYMQACPGALKIMEDIAAPPIVPQARALEPQEVRTVRDATQSCITAIVTPHTVEKQTASANLKTKIQGFGNFEPPPDEAEDTNKKKGVANQVNKVGEFVADSIGDMVDDFKEKGAVGALKDATVDALDLVLDGVDGVWGWVVGSKADDQPRICQPQGAQLPNGQFMQMPGAGGHAPGFQSTGGAVPQGGFPGGFAPQQPIQGFQPPAKPNKPASASSAYAAAFGGVVGANNPINPGMGGGQPIPGMHGSAGGYGQQPYGAAPYGAAPYGQQPAPAPAAAPKEPERPPAAPMVDLLDMDAPAATTPGGSAAPAVDLLDMGGPTSPSQQATTNMLDF